MLYLQCLITVPDTRRYSINIHRRNEEFLLRKEQTFVPGTTKKCSSLVCNVFSDSGGFLGFGPAGLALLWDVSWWHFFISFIYSFFFFSNLLRVY